MKFKYLIALLIPLCVVMAQEEPMPGPTKLKDDNRVFHPDGTNSVSDRAIGLLDKGQVSNVVTNYGILSDFHLSEPALHWPRNGSDVQHYGFGVQLLMVLDGELLASIYSPASQVLDFGWEAWDNSWGMLYNDERTDYNTAGDGVTPFLAFSDIRSTWPVFGETPTWPGYFREDLQNPGQFVTGEFTSDRDIFCTLRDDYGMGLKVNQTAYCYGRWYSEDIIFVRFRLFNEGSNSYDSCYVGYQADLRPDFYPDDYINYMYMDDEADNPDFFYKWDGDGIPENTEGVVFEDWVGPIGYVGIGMIETPNNLGVTSFHFYHDDSSATITDYFPSILSNNYLDTLENIGSYFHGEDHAFDDPALWYELDNDTIDGSKITFTIGSGPFQLLPGDSIDFSLIFAFGEDSTDLKANIDTANYIATELAYQGSGPPLTPNVTAVPGDGYVKIYWDNRAETSIDAISEEMDFEGYKVYRSTDFGETWGDPVTNFYGDQVGWVPIAQFDLVDSIMGLDPAYGPTFFNANNWLGDDTGLKHSYVDSNVTNGFETWYCVTSYDRGVYDPEEPSKLEPSYENVIGASQYDQNVVAVTPQTEPVDLEGGNIGLPVEIDGKQADGTLDIAIVDQNELLDHDYQITFNDSGDVLVIGEDTVTVEQLSLNLEDLTEGSFVFTNALTDEEFIYKNIPAQGDDQPIVNGFRIIVEDIDGFGVNSIGWTVVNGDSMSSFDWWTENRHPGNNQAYDEVVEGLDDWRITITEDSVDVQVIAAGFGVAPPDSTFRVPLKVERGAFELSGAWVDATEFLQISDLKVMPEFQNSTSVGPYGWDLNPGGNAYNPDPTYGTFYPDILVLRDDDNDTTGSMIYLLTQNGPDSAIAPSVGDVFEIITFKPFNNSLVYEFSTESQTISSSKLDLSKIKVVPNPIIVSSGLESNPYESKVMFTHLPSQCTIDIYTVSANKVVSLDYNAEDDGVMYWDLLNHEGQKVAYGVYVYVVKSKQGESHTGKLMVIR